MEALAIVAFVAPALLSSQSCPLQVRTKNAMTTAALAQAGCAAAVRLRQSDCARIFWEFRDANGRTLQQRLDELGRSGSAHLQAVYFYDGANRRGCQSRSTLAVTEPGSVVIYVCPQFGRSQRQDPSQASVVLIHELLHTLGLGEDPPSSEVITRHVKARCGR